MAPVSPNRGPSSTPDRRPSAVDGLVQGLRSSEADRSIEADGRGVLGGDFEVGASEPGLVEALERLADQGMTQAHPPEAGDDPEVLDGPDRPPIHHPLDGPAISLGARDEPGRDREEPRLPADLAHQAL